MKIIAVFAAAAAAVAVSIPAFAQSEADNRDATTRSDVQARVARMFAATDANRDGFVTQAEAAARGGQAARRQGGERQADRAGRMDAHFAELDADRNGSISRAEFDSQHARGREGREERRAERAERRADRVERRNARSIAMRPRQFERMDINKDGRLSLAEASARPLARFARADANGDGTLTREERRAARQKMQAQRQQRRAG